MCYAQKKHISNNLNDFTDLFSLRNLIRTVNSTKEPSGTKEPSDTALLNVTITQTCSQLVKLT